MFRGWEQAWVSPREGCDVIASDRYPFQRRSEGRNSTSNVSSQHYSAPPNSGGVPSSRIAINIAPLGGESQACTA